VCVVFVRSHGFSLTEVSPCHGVNTDISQIDIEFNDTKLAPHLFGCLQHATICVIFTLLYTGTKAGSTFTDLNCGTDKDPHGQPGQKHQALVSVGTPIRLLLGEQKVVVGCSSSPD
jgi:hypothetical protein